MPCRREQADSEALWASLKGGDNLLHFVDEERLRMHDSVYSSLRASHGNSPAHASKSPILPDCVQRWLPPDERI